MNDHRFVDHRSDYIVDLLSNFDHSVVLSISNHFKPISIEMNCSEYARQGLTLVCVGLSCGA